MPTIFEQINSALSGNALTGQLAAQVSKISGGSTQLQALMHGHLPALDGFAGSLNSIAPPSLSIPASFSGAFSALHGTIPSDLSGLTGGVSGALNTLTGNVDTNIAAKLKDIVESLEALQKLMQTGFAPLDVTPSGGAAAGGAGAAGPSAGSPSAGSSPGTPSGAAPSGAGGSAGAGAGASGGGGSATQDEVAAARQRRIQSIQQANTFLSALPPFTAPSFVTFAQNIIKNVPREMLQIRKVPLIDDLADMLTNIVVLREMDVTALTAYIRDTTTKLGDFLTSNGVRPVTDLTAKLAALSTHLNSAALKAQSDTLAARLANIGGAVASGNVSGSAADIAAANTALDQLLPMIAALNHDLFNGQVDAATRSFELLPVDMERHMRRVLQGIEPVDQLKIFQAIGDRVNAAVREVSAEELAGDVEKVLGPVVKALDIVNVIPVREPIMTAVDGLKSASDEIDRMLAEVAAQTGSIFAQADQLLAQVDVSQVTQGVQQAIAGFQSTLQQKVNDLFEPVRAAISDGVSQVSNAVSGFKPDDIIAALRDVIGKLSGALQSSDVQSAINSIHQAIEAATQQIQAISFTPLTGQVTASIDQVTDILKSIDPNLLSTEVKIALTGAVAILPGDLKPVSDPLVVEFGQLVDVGPKPILVQVEAQPQRLLQLINDFSPARLIGDQLSKPFQELTGKMEQFKPSALLAPVEQALNGLKDQLKQKADPGPLLKPLEDLFNQLMAQLDKLKPEELVKPLNDLVQGAVNKLLAVLPVEAVLHTLDDILGRIKAVSDTAVAVKTTLEKVPALFDGLADAENQLRAWLQPLFDHIGQISNVATLQPSFDHAAAAVDALKAASMRSALNAALTPLQKGISDLNPALALSSIGAAYGSVHPDAVGALPSSSQKTQIQALLARFNPISADFSRPYEGLKRFLDDLARHQTAFERLLSHWDLRFHGSDGPFAGFIHPAVTAEDLKSVFRAALENQVIQPLGHFLGVFHTIATTAKPPLAKITAAIDHFEEKVEDLLLGPTAFGGISDAVHSLIQRLHNINFNFLVTQLNATFQALKAKLQAVSPAAVRAVIQQAFDNALKLLDIHQLLPQPAIAAIDQTYQKIIDDLKAFDPKKLIIDVVEPEFQSTIVPIVQAFDITALIQAVIDRLDGLKVELRTELDKVNQHYQAMLQAVPKMSLSDVAGAVGGAISGAIGGDLGGSLGF